MYNKQGFIDGQKIRASHLNHMEEGILDASNGYISIEQTSESTEDGGENVIKATRADGTFDNIIIRNGSKGSAGPKGDKGDPGSGGASSWNDLTDKPFGLTEGAVLVEEQTIELVEADGMYVANVGSNGTITAGDVVVVYWNGTATLHEVFFMDGSFGFGDINTLSPYVFILAEGGTFVVLSSTVSGRVTVKVTKGEVTKLPMLYMPVVNFYFNGLDSYLYSDVGCTVKVTKENLIDALNEIIRVSLVFSGAMVFGVFCPIEISPYDEDEYGCLAIQLHSERKILYTAEYTGS